MSTPDTAYSIGLSSPGPRERLGVEGNDTNSNLYFPGADLRQGEEVDLAVAERAYFADFYSHSHNGMDFDLTSVLDCE